MMDRHVSAEQYAVALIAEEAAETIQMIGKWLRFGPDHARRDGMTARVGLSREAGDLLAAIDYGVAAGVLDHDALQGQRKAKLVRLTDPKAVNDQGGRLAPAVRKIVPPEDGTAHLEQTIAILRRALAWHGDRQRLATTREEWQQEVDAAIVWVKDNPEMGRPSFPKLACSASIGGPPVDGDNYYPRERIARLCLSALFGFEFTGESLCDEADRIFSVPNPRAARAVSLADAIADVLAAGEAA